MLKFCCSTNPLSRRAVTSGILSFDGLGHSSRRRSGPVVSRRAGVSPGSRRRPVPQSHRMQDSRERRRIQRRGQSRGLLRHPHRHRERHGRLSDWRFDRRARSRHGRSTLLQAVRTRRSHRPEHGDRLQRSRFRRAPAGGVLQSSQRSRRTAEARRFRLEGHFRRGVRWFHSGGIFAALSPTTAI